MILHSGLINLLPVCSHHHHLIHTLRWKLHFAADRTLTVTDHHGHTVMVTTPDMPHQSRSPGEPRRRTEPIRADLNLLAS